MDCDQRINSLPDRQGAGARKHTSSNLLQGGSGAIVSGARNC